MLPYLLLLGIPALSAGIKSGKDRGKPRSKAPIHAFFLIWIVLLCLRDISVGTDLVNYKVMFNNAAKVGWLGVFTAFEEPGYFFLSKLAQVITGDFQFFLAVTAMLSVVPIWYFYKKESVIPFLTIVLFVSIAPFSMFFSGIRQVLAMAFAIPAYYAAKKKKPLRFIVTVLVASVFHQSAIVLLLLYPVYRVKLSKQIISVAIPAFMLVLVFNRQIFTLLLNFLGDRYVERYSEMTATGAYTVVILLLVLVFYSFIIPDEETMDKDTMGLRNLLLLSCAIQCFAPVHSIAMRFNYYFLIFIPILIPKIVVIAKKQHYKLASFSVTVMCVVFSAYFFINLFAGADILDIYPYIPFWS